MCQLSIVTGLSLARPTTSLAAVLECSNAKTIGYLHFIEIVVIAQLRPIARVDKECE